MAVTATGSSTPTLTSAGIGSGLDVNGLVSKLMSVESLPVTALNNKTASYQTQLSAYGTISSALSTLQTAAQAMSTTARMTAYSASIADTTVLAASADSTASAGSHTIVVTSLAQAQSVRTATGVTSTALSGTGSLTLDFGNYGQGAKVAGTAPVGTTALTTGTLSINGVDITTATDGTDAATQGANIAAAINAAKISNVTAKADANTGAISLTSTNGTAITIAGTAPESAGFTAGSTPGTSTLFYADSTRSSKIAITNSNNTISGIRDAINAANVGVTASVVSGADGSHLVINSNSSGASNALRITATQTGAPVSTGPALSSFAYDASTGGTTSMTKLADASDANLTVDGLAVTSASNVVTSAIQGMTLNLSKAGSTTLTVAKSVSSVMTSVQSFVTAYNAVNTQIRNATSFDATTGTASTLTGDSTTRTILNQLRSILNTRISSAPSGSQVLSDFGITFQKDGSLAVDSTKIATALNDPNKDVTKLFASGGLAVQLNTSIGNMLTSGGLLAGHTAGINTQMQAITKQIASLNVHLAVVQKNYLKQFTNLDAMISSMTATSTYLTQQFATLAKTTSSA